MKRRVVKNSDDVEESAMMNATGNMPSSSSSCTFNNNSNSNYTSSSLSSKTGPTVIPFLLILIGILIGFSIYQREQFDQHSQTIVQTLQGEIQSLEKLRHDHDIEIHDLSTSKQTLEQTIVSNEKELTKLQTQLMTLKKERATLTKTRSNSNDETLEKLQHENEIVKQQYHHLKEEMQRHDKNAVLEKFGEGPYKVEFQLEFPPDEIPEGTGTSFIVELAPIELMPHTVHFFLQQVSKGLLNGNSFHRNAGHVVQAGPTTNHLNQGVNLRKPFNDADLKSVSFQEYHPDFPHVKYTLGYAGRPGGPDFYVSTRDNTLNHGPGGQASYAIASEADPCFAKVVEGFDTVDRMTKMSVQPGSYKRMQHYVAIKSVQILNDMNT